jgi:hypothetical protein
MYQKLNDHVKVLDIWTRISSGELYDPDFSGMDLIVHYLKFLHDKALVLRYGAWIISRDPIKGVQIFIDRDDDLFEPIQVLLFLQSFNSACRIEYLEHLIIKKGVVVFIILH